ncbi:SSI family serine proteinase inhibitor [Actinomadura rayongensis]|uniref:Subtilisin inhibitor domain-containing protein n=1 Tax=Actinomadura rayongensis TaxID=1429076 RepID=A0A6I4WBB7_9ACTN|nr:SSI family serine proteinase inhibitor [Actinomadura rayongensis]MXQ64344.1 hypothetical protein [Actinomadura rayongensis]
MPHLVHAVLTGAALALLPAVPAAAGAPAPAELRLSVQRGADVRTVVLRCGPAGGTHPQAARACAELARGGGKVDRPSDGVFCTMDYAPVTASAQGRYGRGSVRFSKEYSNACVMRARTGTLFAF